MTNRVVDGSGDATFHQIRFLPLSFLEGTELLVNSPRPNAILRVIARALAHDADPLAKPSWWAFFIQLNVLFRWDGGRVVGLLLIFGGFVRPIVAA
jgi:hypothetical protein